MVPPDFFKFFWLGWIFAFAIIEWYAVHNGIRGGTFSEFVWWIIGSGKADREWYRWLARGLLLALMLWLIPHFYTRWKWW